MLKTGVVADPGSWPLAFPCGVGCWPKGDEGVVGLLFCAAAALSPLPKLNPMLAWAPNPADMAAGVPDPDAVFPPNGVGVMPRTDGLV